MARDRAIRPETKPMRLFVAADVPEDVRTALDQRLEALRADVPARWTPSTNWHVTLKFLGRTWPRLRSWVEREVALVARTQPVFRTRLAPLGTFPPGRRSARVLWAGLEDRSGGFARLVTGLDAALAREFEPESRAFTPHLTIARFDPPREVPALPDVWSDPFAVERIVLYRSHLRRPAPVYEPLATFPLGAG